MEEIGCQIEVLGEIGKTIEYKDRMNLKQTSYCYSAKKIGDAKLPTYTKEEIDDGFEVVWAEDIDDAINLARTAIPSNYEGEFIKKRDLAFLEAAKLKSE